MAQLYSRDGGEVLVNSITAENQLGPAMVRLASGNYVIVWTSQVGASSLVYEVRGQLYSADGSPIGGEFLASASSGFRAEARVGALSTGGFVVTWVYDVHDGTGLGSGPEAYRIRGQVYDSAGAKVGGEVPIGPNTTGWHLDPQVVGLAGGGFAVSWTLDTRPSLTLERDAVVQLFDSAGTATSGLVAIPASNTGSQSQTALAALPGGGFIASWTDGNSSAAGDTSSLGVKMQAFDSAGAKVGGESRVNTTTSLQQFSPSVATLASGGFVISWTDSSATGGDTSGSAVRAQMYDSAGAKTGGEFLVNSQVEGEQLLSSVAALPGGGFVVVWRDGTSTDADIKAQVFDSAGAKAGLEFVVNSVADGLQSLPVVLGLADGSFVASWTDSGGSDGSLQGVKAQLLAPTAAAPSDIALSVDALEETAIENVTVGILSTEGAVNSGFTYQIIADSSGGAFRIEGDRLVVDDNAKLNFEVATQVTVTIRTTDSNGQSYDEDFTLDVLDVGYERRYSEEPVVQANLTEAGIESGSKIVPLADGGFALIWQQLDLNDPTPAKTVMRFFGADGAPQSLEYVIAEEWLGGYAVTPLLTGGVLIVREAFNEPAGTNSIKAQAYDSEANAAGPEITVGSTTDGNPSGPSAVELSSGEYLISWVTPAGEIHAQRIDPATGLPTVDPETGLPIAHEIVITSSFESAPIGLVATAPSGFIAAWVVPRQSSEDPFILRAQMYNYQDQLTGEDFIALEVGAMDISDVTVIALADGSFMLGWVETVDEIEGIVLKVVMAQPISATGLLIGEPLELTAFLAESDFGEVSFAAHPDQGFVVLWPMLDFDGGTGDHSYVGSLFNECGCPIGSAFQATELGFAGVATVLADGTIATSWSGQDSDETGVFARVYRPADEPIDNIENDDVLVGDDGPNSLDGGGGNDQLYGLGGDDDLIGGVGNDIIDGGPGADDMAGGAGNDVYFVDDAGDSVVENSGEGRDEIRTGLAVFSLAGLPNVENLVGTSDSGQRLTGNAADNVILAGAGSDFIDLQAGGDDHVTGGEGRDVFLLGGSMNSDDVIDGGDGIDQIALQGDYAGAEALVLGSNMVSIENIAILPGLDTRFGDPGTNFYSYEFTLQNEAVASGVQLVVDANRLRVGEDFTFNGSAETDGSFFIYGGGGTDTLTGGAKNDVFIFGGQGQWGASDVVTGGGGIDQLALRGNYTIVFGAGQLIGIEQIGMVSAQDTRYGALGSSYSYNLTLVDANVDGIQMTVDAAPLRPGETLTFDGSAEDDGSFRVFGGRGNDIIVGSRNGDTLVGNAGADILTGGAGADSFRYLNGDSAPGAADRILDFLPGTDAIDLARIDADTNVDGNQAFHWIGSNAFGSSGTPAGELRAYQSGNSWFVEGDTDGNGTADLLIEIITPAPLGQSDFVL